MDNHQVTIEIKDSRGRVLETHTKIEQYFILSKTGQTFNKSFSHPDYTVQLGLLDFAQAQLIGEIMLKKQ